jgi:hypothetical protein
MTKKYPKSLGKCNASTRSSKHQERLTNYHVGFCSLSKLFGIHADAPSRIFRGQRTLDRDNIRAIRLQEIIISFILNYLPTQFSFTFFHDKKVRKKSRKMQ